MARTNLIKNFALGVALVFASLGAAQAQDRALDSDFSVEGIKWNRGGETLLVYTVGQSGGKAIVCGVYVNEGTVPSIVMRKLLQSASVKVGRTTIVSNLSFFREVRGKSDLRSARAPCRVSRRAWSDALAKTKPKLRFPRKSVEF